MKVKELTQILANLKDEDLEKEIVLEIYSDMDDLFYKGCLQSVSINNRAELAGELITKTDYNGYAQQYDPPGQGEDYNLCYKGRKEKDPDWLDVMFKSLFENGSFEDISD